MAQRTPEAFRDCLSHISGYVAHELTTPLGSGLEDIRRVPPPPGRTPFRTFGTFGVWFPRGLLLRLAARTTCRRIIDGWLAAGEGQLAPEAKTEVAAAETGVEYLYEPAPQQIFDELLPRHIEIQVYRALLESAAAEHAARMTVMDLPAWTYFAFVDGSRNGGGFTASGVFGVLIEIIPIAGPGEPCGTTVDGGVPLGRWAQHWFIQNGVEVGTVALFGWIPFGLMRRFPRRWWLVTGALVVPFLFFMAMVKPVWIDPLLNHYGPLHDNALEREIRMNALEAGFIR